jgi:hypothetical protein
MDDDELSTAADVETNGSVELQRVAPGVVSNNRAITIFFFMLLPHRRTDRLPAARPRGGLRLLDPDHGCPGLLAGASVADTLTQLTDPLEKEPEQTPNLDYLRTYTKPGRATIVVNLKESTPRASSRRSGTRSARRSATSR